jgi:hypothetical protein
MNSRSVFARILYKEGLVTYLFSFIFILSLTSRYCVMELGTGSVSC